MGELNPALQLWGGWGTCPKFHGYACMNSWFCPTGKPEYIKVFLGQNTTLSLYVFMALRFYAFLFLGTLQ